VPGDDRDGSPIQNKAVHCCRDQVAERAGGDIDGDEAPNGVDDGRVSCCDRARAAKRWDASALLSAGRALWRPAVDGLTIAGIGLRERLQTEVAKSPHRPANETL
jgi:hypothetical protein